MLEIGSDKLVVEGDLVGDEDVEEVSVAGILHEDVGDLVTLYDRGGFLLVLIVDKGDYVRVGKLAELDLLSKKGGDAIVPREDLHGIVLSVARVKDQIDGKFGVTDLFYVAEVLAFGEDFIDVLLFGNHGGSREGFERLRLDGNVESTVHWICCREFKIVVF